MTTRRNPRPWHLLAVLLGGAALVFTGAQSATAHDYLVSTSPEDGATVQKAPSQVTLTFNDVVLTGTGTGTNAVVVTGPDGSDDQVQQGDVTVSGRDVTTNVKIADSGTYQVQWRVVSADGHPVSGDQSFTYDPDASDEASAPTDTRDPDQSSAPAPKEKKKDRPTTGSAAEPGGDHGDATTDGSEKADSDRGKQTQQGTDDGAEADGQNGANNGADGADGASNSASATGDSAEGPNAVVVAVLIALGVVVLVGGGTAAILLRKRPSDAVADTADEEHPDEGDDADDLRR